jgi:hypothetical protein
VADETLSPLPVREFLAVTHIGTLNTEDRKTMSYEGDGLSVSVDPDAWEYIARLGGSPWWTLTSTDGGPLRFLDAHALTDAQTDAIHEWAASHGLVTRGTAYRVYFWDDELDGEVFQMTSRVEAETEAEDRDDARIETVDAWLPTASFTSRGRCVDLSDTPDIVLATWVEQARPDLHGVWWNDTLDPVILSAPRGVIVPARLTAVTVSAGD